MHVDMNLSSLFGQNCLIFLLSIKFVACFVIVAVIMWIVVVMVVSIIVVDDVDVVFNDVYEVVDVVVDGFDGLIFLMWLLM